MQQVIIPSRLNSVKNFGFLIWWSIISSFALAGVSPADVYHYNIHLRFDRVNKKAIAEVTLSVQFNATTSALELAAHHLLIRNAKLQHTNLTFACDTIRHRLNLTLDRFYSPGEKQDLVLFYETRYVNTPDPNAIGGSFGKGIRFIEPSLVNPAKRSQIWAQGELTSTSWWLPCSLNPFNLCTTECSATVDSSFWFITNGQFQKKLPHPDGTVTFYYKSNTAYPVHLIAFASARYTPLTQTANAVQLNTFCYPDETEAAKASTVHFPDMLQFLEHQTEFPYPFQQYNQVMLQGYPFPGLTGSHSLGLLSDNFVDDYSTHQDYQYLWDGVSFHALASQWFGQVIIPAGLSDQWLSKGFAQYFEGLYTTQQHGDAEYLLWYHPWESGNYFNDWDNGNRHPIVPHTINDTLTFAGDSYARYRGALVLRMLRAELGDTLFFQSIRHFIKRHAFKPVQTSDFITAVNSISGKDLNWFFKQWLYQTGHPVFKFKGTYHFETKRYILTIRQEQQNEKATSYPATDLFKGKMIITINQYSTTIFIKDQPVNSFTFALEQAPEMIIPDAGTIWIKELYQEKTTAEWRRILLNSKDVTAQSTAITELVNVCQQPVTNAITVQESISALKQLIESNAYWRLRLNALTQLQKILKAPYDEATVTFLKNLIRKEKSWMKAGAVTALGLSESLAHIAIYTQCLNDSSERVISAAAIALGKTKGPGVFEQLVTLKQKPSWKNQSLLHCLNGMMFLNDPRVEDIALEALTDNQSPRWFLGNGWDYPFVAVKTLNHIGKTDKAVKLLLDRFHTALNENNTDDIFYQTLLISALGHPQGKVIFEPLKQRYKQDENALNAVHFYESQLIPASGK